MLFNTSRLSLSTNHITGGGVGEVAQKVIELDMFHVKSYAFDFEMA